MRSSMLMQGNESRCAFLLHYMVSLSCVMALDMHYPSFDMPGLEMGKSLACDLNIMKSGGHVGYIAPVLLPVTAIVVQFGLSW